MHCRTCGGSGSVGGATSSSYSGSGSDSDDSDDSDCGAGGVGSAELGLMRRELVRMEARARWRANAAERQRQG
eukprot:COSAG01_NODE_52508_length_346_cov_0.825911_1_plen_72_part_01